MKKIIVLVLFIILGFMLNRFIKNIMAAYSDAPESVYNINSPVQKVVGGDRDEHGCIGSAGYSWCEVKSKCLRVWEESCP